MIRQAKLGEFLAKRSRGIVPASTPDETFELYSVPAFEAKRPEVVTGGQIGSNKQIVDPGTVLLCKINPRINRAWVVGSFTKHQKIASTEWITFLPHADLEPRYLAHYLSRKEIRDHLAANASGVGGSLMRVKASTVEGLPLPLPNVDQQRRIVAEIDKQFSRLDEAVANLKRVKANLKRYKAAVLKAAVEGRLVPTESERARREGRDFETGEQLLLRILEARRSQWTGKGKYKAPIAPSRDDTLPPLPDGWTWASVDQLLANVTDGDHQPPPQTDAGVPFLVISNVRSGKIDFESTRFVGSNYFESIDESRRPKSGDLLYTLVGSYGIVVPVKTDRKFCIQRHIAILRPHRESPVEYLALALASNVVFNQATACATGTAQLTVPLSGLRALAVPLPPAAEQARIVKEVDRRLSISAEVAAEVAVSLQRARGLREATLRTSFRSV
ncbi:MAG: hypothetical protein ACK54C_14780 [Betaproteobacteria bacterium]